ncbi:hypothetical protein [Homoserinibacter gongjuensis]|nr:hypothetical protein [Homoserinibacter gongjuensis]
MRLAVVMPISTPGSTSATIATTTTTRCIRCMRSPGGVRASPGS